MLAATMLFAGTAFADEIRMPETVTQIDAESGSMTAVVTAEEIGDNYITAKNDQGTLIQFNITDSTVLLNSETGDAIGISDIKAGDEFMVDYSSVMTKSLPGQTEAYLIATNVNKGGAINLINVTDVKENEDGSLTVTDKPAGIILTIQKDATVKPYKTKNIVKISDIAIGTKLAAWYDVVALSYPAQASTNKVVIVDNTPIDTAFAVDTETTEDTGITREAFSVLTYDMLDGAGKISRARTLSTGFSDVSNEKINALAGMEIISGRGENIFAPNDKITAEEAAVILSRAAKYLNVELPSVKIDPEAEEFKDVSEWALPAVASLKTANVMELTAPKANVTASDAAKAIENFSALNK